MQAVEIDYTYLISQLQDAEGELEQHDARLTRLERAVVALSLSPGQPYTAGAEARLILETDVSEFITN